MKRTSICSAIVVAIAVFAASAGAQAPAPGPTGFKRTELGKHDISYTGHEAITTKGAFDPGGMVPKHTHFGEEIGYVQDGEITVDIEGVGPTKVKAGETFFVPAGKVHSAKNTGGGTATVVSTYVVEKGKPLATFVK